MAFEGPWQDRLLIRERMNAYSDSVFQADPEAWLANWDEDCVWHALGLELRGKPALREQWTKIWSTLEKMGFFTEVGAIRADGDRATARCYCREILFLKDGGMQKLIGAYDDELVRRDGVWLFASRRYELFKVEPTTAG